jgi:MFS transporter, DHA2 family, multidrug resistance protein
VPAFDAALAANTFGFFVNFGIAVFIAQYLQLVHGLSPFEAGLWTVPYAGAFVVGALMTPLFVRRIRPCFVMAAGLTLAGAGLALLTQVEADSALAVLISGSVVFALGLAPVYTLAADLMVGAARPSGPGRPRGSRRPAPNSAARSASRSWAPSARPSTATRSPTPSRPRHRPTPRRPHATRSAPQ